MKRFRANEGGFTLIELIVVMIIIGILVLLATPRFIRYVKDANATSLQVDAKVVGDADLYQNIRAYDEAGFDMDKTRGKEYTMLEIFSLGYNHPIFTEGFDNGSTASVPNFNDNDIYEFDNWLLAMAGSFEEVTGKVILNDDKTELSGVDADDFWNTKYAAVSDDVLANHIRNTRYGVHNFMVATNGLAEGEAYYMGYVENGDNILYVSLIPSNVDLIKN